MAITFMVLLACLSRIKTVTKMGQLTRQGFLTAQTATAKRETCGDCGTKEGQLHILGCDMESCPFCGNQLVSCECVYKKLGIDAQQEDWEKLLSDKGRIPFILYPNLCAKCGTLWPEMFVVLDAEWKHYIEPQMRREMLCEACYIQI